jgi:hypothetical protein
MFDDLMVDHDRYEEDSCGQWIGEDDCPEPEPEELKDERYDVLDDEPVLTQKQIEAHEQEIARERAQLEQGFIDEENLLEDVTARFQLSDDRAERAHRSRMVRRVRNRHNSGGRKQWTNPSYGRKGCGGDEYITGKYPDQSWKQGLVVDQGGYMRRMSDPQIDTNPDELCEYRPNYRKKPSRRRKPRGVPARPWKRVRASRQWMVGVVRSRAKAEGPLRDSFSRVICDKCLLAEAYLDEEARFDEAGVDEFSIAIVQDEHMCSRTRAIQILEGVDRRDSWLDRMTEDWDLEHEQQELGSCNRCWGGYCEDCRHAIPYDEYPFPRTYKDWLKEGECIRKAAILERNTARVMIGVMGNMGREIARAHGVDIPRSADWRGEDLEDVRVVRRGA